MRRSIPLLVLAGSLAWFALACGSSGPSEASPGSLHVISQPLGLGTDSSGFSVILDGTQVGTLGRADTLIIPSLTAGQHTVALADLSTNCLAQGALQRTVNVVPAATQTEAYLVDCLDPIHNRIFVSTPSGLYTLSPDSSDLKPLVLSTDSIDFPSPAPDGSHFVYHTYVGSTNRLVVARTDGTDSHAIPIPCDGEQPAWSPSGDWIAFVCRDTSGVADVYLTHPDGSRFHSITHTSTVSEEHPSWSPDGTRLVVAFIVGGGGGGLAILPVSGIGTPTQITFDDFDRSPEWAPSDEVIAYTHGVGLGNRPIYTITSAGDAPTPVTTVDYDNSEPTWSPDGLRLAFLRHVATSYDLFVVNADGTGEHPSTTGSTIRTPRWSR